MNTITNPIGMNTAQSPSHQLAKQLAATFSRLSAVEVGNETPSLLEQTLQLVLEALEVGQISLNMETAFSKLELSNPAINSVAEWQQSLMESGVASIPGGFTPLIIDGNQLYLARYHLYHSQLQQRLTALSTQTLQLENAAELTQMLDRLFPSCDFTVDWQKVAAALALKKRLCVISGGPGTGKTTTVLRLLAALSSAQSGLRIRLAAPTGKAAARMQESIRKEVHKLDCDAAIKESFNKLEASTIHRLLGYQPNSVNFRHHAENPLALDVLVIDESSMIDSAMMAKCLDALPNNARVILLGDKDQLPAVEPGSPFASLCSQFGFSQDFCNDLEALSGQNLSEFTSPQSNPLADNLVFLRHSYRFKDDSGIGQLAKLINAGGYRDSLELMQGDSFADIHWQDYKAQEYRRVGSKITDPLVNRIKQGFAPYIESLNAPVDVATVFNAYNQFCLLTAMHKGYTGRIETNELCQKALNFPSDNKWYHGRPIMISQNDYQTGLYNGDVGICLQQQGSEVLRVYFPTSDGFKDFTPSRIPAHETAFAMTVHKSQGSEFNNVVFLLPDAAKNVFSNSLVYTAITRAKERVELWGKNDVLLGCGS